jgi:hypothetical protein
MTAILSELRADRALLPGIFLVFVSARDCVNCRAIVLLEGLGELKKLNYLIGNRTRNFPACSVVPQATTLRRTVFNKAYQFRKNDTNSFNPANQRRLSLKRSSCYFTTSIISKGRITPYISSLCNLFSLHKPA